MSYLLWFDDSKKEATAKVVDAVAAYHEKFNRAPNTVLVNEGEALPATIAACAVRAQGYVRRHNFWVGVE